MTSVQQIDDRAGFERLEREWQVLLATSPAISPFLNFSWLYPWWTHLAGSRRLLILVVRSGGRLIGLAPLCEIPSGLLRFSRYEFLGTGFAGSDYLDILAEGEAEEDVANAVKTFFRSSNAAVRLDHLPLRSCATRVADGLAEQGWTARQTRSGVCPYIRLAGYSWDTFLATLPSSHRATIRRRLNGLERKFHVQFDRVAEELDRKAAVDALGAFHANRFDCQGGSTAFATKMLMAFHHDATARALAEGWLRLYTLRLDGDIAAVLYGFRFKNRFYFYQHGFAQKYRQHSPGRAVVELAIREALAEHCDEFDMLYGEEAYKAFWPVQKRELIRIEMFPPHIGGRIHQQTVAAERTMRTLARRVVSMYSHGAQTS